MISVEEALSIILSQVKVMGTERVDITSSLGRVIAEDIYVRRDNPPWDNSAMDGYAVRFEDIKGATKENPAVLRVIEDLPAGYVAKKTVGKGEVVRIMTGAPVPKGADTVVMVEDTEKEGERARIFRETPLGENIRKAGEDIKAGELVVPKGTMIRPAEVGIIATCGRAFVSVYQRPRVAVISTGDELVDVDEELSEGKILSSNSYTLSSMAAECGADAFQLGIAKDTREALKEKLQQALHADVIITSGGVSEGDFDFVKDVLKELGSEMKFWKVAMKPGKPLAFGTIGGKPAFGLPGNPVSCMVCFEQFARPSLLKMMGHGRIYRPVVQAVLKEEIKKKPGRKHFIRSFARLEEGRYTVTTTGDQGSGILKSMVAANGLLIFPEELSTLKAGDVVKVQLIDRSFDFAEGPGY
ncbi:MAG: molybdopterin molybdotransferase MoeA [Deltaproteobacteria bacterium]|nr:molybdopterin molybdotransferase MoeA [Deltaproteobacteria bacterium]